MPDQVMELAERGKALSPEERSRLVDLLLESLHEPAIAEVQAAWEVEIECRLGEYDRGEVESSMPMKFFPKREASPGDQAPLPAGRGGGLAERSDLLLECPRGPRHQVSCGGQRGSDEGGCQPGQRRTGSEGHAQPSREGVSLQRRLPGERHQASGGCRGSSSEEARLLVAGRVK